MSILIGADFVPTGSNIKLFTDADVKALLGEELLTCIRRAEYRIFNLELPLCDVENPIKKCGPHLVAPSSAIAAYKALNVDLLTLANNHILDQGEDGLLSTIKTLSENQIGFVGAGKNLAEASQGCYFHVSGKKFGVYACAEHEFSICSDSKAGANPYDALFSFDHVQQMKAGCDFVIVLFHGGKEHYRYPSPNLQRVCRRFIDKGADLVVCQHSHCIGCEEKYSSGLIVYGQGNFLFDYSDNAFWQTGLLLSIDENLKIEYIPIVKNGNGTRLADAAEKKEIMNDFMRRTHEISDPAFVKEVYSEFAKKCAEDYLSAAIGKRGLLPRAMNRLSKGRFLNFEIERKYGEKELLRFINILECEAHREMCASGFLERIERKQ